MGALYSEGDKIARSNLVAGSSSRTKGALRIPSGSALSALFHNHPPRPGRLPSQLAKFSDEDKAQARRLGVPSYISAGDRVMRYDPSTGKAEEVLAQLPIDEIRKLYLVEALKK